MNDKFYTNERNVQIVISLLKAHGIRKVVASPGTTNLTLVASMQQDPYFEMYSSVDERSAAYIACGMAEESGEPVVISCTGATASRNYMPGLTEAYYRKLPIVAITSTQGNHRIGSLIAQNIDRRVRPNDIAKCSVYVPVIHDRQEEKACEIDVNKALLELRHHGGGPVHINLQTSYSRDYSVKELPTARVINRITAFDEFPELPNGRIAIFVGSHKQMSNDLEEAIDNFCSSNDSIVFCDHTSGYHGKYRIQVALIGGQRQYVSKIQNVDTLIHIGEVSGNYYHSISLKTVWRVSEDGELRDTFGKLRYVFEMSEQMFFNHYVKPVRKDDTYLNECKAEYDKIFKLIPELPFGNIWMAKQMAAKLPANSVLHLGILNTLRSWNFFEIPHAVRSYCNVGGFGIDGNVSSMIGASLASPDKLFIGIFGDLAFFYDMNVLGNHHVGSNIRIMLINNGKGAEFRIYEHPGAVFGESADKYIAAAGHYGSKSPKLVRHYAEDLGFEYLSAKGKDDFNKVLPRFLTTEKTEKPMLFEVFTDSEDESESLRTMLNLISTPTGKLKKVVKSMLGIDKFNALKKAIRKE